MNSDIYLQRLQYLHPLASWEYFLEAAVLAFVRLSAVCAFAPVFSSPAISLRVKAVFVMSLTVLMVLPILHAPQYKIGLNLENVLGELSVGLIYGMILALLSEALAFAGILIGMQFSFSLVNLLDPNSMIETPVLGQLLNWVATLTLLSSGLHLILLRSFLNMFNAVPLGHAVLPITSGPALGYMIAGVFFAGIQLAAPVMAAALTVEVTIALMGRLSPQLPAVVFSIPIKTTISYLVLVASLSLWPLWIEGRFSYLLQSAEQIVTAR